MLGKRQRPTMRRTSSISLIGSGSVNGESSPLPEHPKEKLKSSSKCPSSAPPPCAPPPRQVIGFHPKVFIEEELDHHSSPISPRRSSGAPSSQPARSNSKSPSGSPRSGLGDLLAAGSQRPWERKDEGRVGLGIVAALSGSQEDVVSNVRDEGRSSVYSSAVPTPNNASSRKTTSPSSSSHAHAHPHMPSVFAPSRASPPIPIHPSNSNSNSGYRGASHRPNCGQASAFGPVPSSARSESMGLETGSSSHHRGGGVGSRPNTSSSPITWAKTTNPHQEGAGASHFGITSSHNSHQADMEVDRIESLALAASPLVYFAGHNILSAPAGFTQNFLDACHLCRRRLGEGRDIYIYRGDRAFCSPECRHQQILNDERPEKCSSAVMKMGGSDARNSTQRNRVIAAGTAAAA